MFKRINDKVHSMIATLFTFGAVAIVLGIFVTVDTTWLQAIAGLVFFLLAYMAFYIGYKLHTIQCMVKDSMPFAGGETVEKKKRSKK